MTNSGYRALLATARPLSPNGPGSIWLAASANLTVAKLPDLPGFLEHEGMPAPGMPGVYPALIGMVKSASDETSGAIVQPLGKRGELIPLPSRCLGHCRGGYVSVTVARSPFLPATRLILVFGFVDAASVVARCPATHVVMLANIAHLVSFDLPDGGHDVWIVRPHFNDDPSYPTAWLVAEAQRRLAAGGQNVTVCSLEELDNAAQ